MQSRHSRSAAPAESLHLRQAISDPKNRPAKKIFPCPFDRFDKISLRERALTNI
jgi:hypothetical protein